MSILKLPVLYVGSKSEIRLYTLFDSGADVSCISADQVNDLTMVLPLGRIRRITKRSDGHIIEVKEVVCLEFYINDILLRDEFFVVPALGHDVNIGDTTMRKCQIRLNLEEDRVEVNPKVAGIF